jgi:hypothetical protein
MTNCLFYNCTTGVYSLSSYYNTIINSIFSTCTTGIKGHTTGWGAITNYCCFYNNTSNINNGVVNSTDITSDPKLVDPANGDFSLGSGSPCFDAGASLGPHVGLA